MLNRNYDTAWLIVIMQHSNIIILSIMLNTSIITNDHAITYAQLTQWASKSSNTSQSLNAFNKSRLSPGRQKAGDFCWRLVEQPWAAGKAEMVFPYQTPALVWQNPLRPTGMERSDEDSTWTQSEITPIFLLTYQYNQLQKDLKQVFCSTIEKYKKAALKCSSLPQIELPIEVLHHFTIRSPTLLLTHSTKVMSLFTFTVVWKIK